MPDFRRGAAEVEKAQQRGNGGGNFRPFAPSIFWKAGDERFVLIATSVDDMPSADMIHFIPVEHERQDGTTWTENASVIARTDPAIGESSEELVDEWNAKIRTDNLVVAVELEPVTEKIRGRERPVGFQVKMLEVDRRVRDEDGNVTDEVETVTTPSWGFISQAVGNFGASVVAYDQSESPINETPVKIMRVGGDKNTTYQIHGYPELLDKLDVQPFLDSLDSIVYLGDDMEKAQKIAENPPESEVEDGIPPTVLALHKIGNILLDRRLNELADEARYNEILEAVREKGEPVSKFGDNKKDGKKDKKERPSRASQRPDPKDDAEPKTKQESPDAREALEKLRERAARR